MADYLQAYRQGLQQHGTDFEVTLWASRRTQELRFRIFAELESLAGRRILDAGCSRGDLAAWLLAQGIDYGHYIGVDALEPVIEYARSRQLPRTEFHQGDFVGDPSLLGLGRPDVVCISGSLNTMTDEQVLAVLEGAWAAAQEVLMFNFLSSRAGADAPLQDQIARRLDTMWLLDWALTKTSNVVLRHDYFPHGHDATLRLHR